jgi:hypothetical protein
MFSTGTLALIMSSGIPCMAVFSQPSRLLAKLRMACVKEPAAKHLQHEKLQVCFTPFLFFKNV